MCIEWSIDRPECTCELDFVARWKMLSSAVCVQMKTCKKWESGEQGHGFAQICAVNFVL